MHVSHLDPNGLGRAAVLIPLRSLGDGKARLADALDLDERRRLIEQMARNVLQAANGLDVLVVHDDADVEAWATSHGAFTLRPETPGLNEAVSAGKEHLRCAGYGRVIIAHADLPFAEDLKVMCTDDQIAIAPDRQRDGTNVLALRADLDFTFAYGPNSFTRHIDHARSLGIDPRIVDEPGLAWDVDHPDDLPPSLTNERENTPTTSEESHAGNH